MLPAVRPVCIAEESQADLGPVVTESVFLLKSFSAKDPPELPKNVGEGWCRSSMTNLVSPKVERNCSGMPIFAGCSVAWPSGLAVRRRRTFCLRRTMTHEN